MSDKSKSGPADGADNDSPTDESSSGLARTADMPTTAAAQPEKSKGVAKDKPKQPPKAGVAAVYDSTEAKNATVTKVPFPH